MENMNILKTEYGVLEYAVNYVNSDYTPEFFKQNLKTSEEHFYKINIKCLFEVNKKIVENINKVKELLKKATLIENGFEYDLFLESTGDLEITEDSVVEMIFSCNGKIFRKRVTKTVRNGSVITVNSVRDIKLNFFKGSVSGIPTNIQVTLNDLVFSYSTRNGFEINSEKGEIKGLINWDFYKFPKTENKKYTIRLDGIDELLVSYREEI